MLGVNIAFALVFVALAGTFEVGPYLPLLTLELFHVPTRVNRGAPSASSIIISFTTYVTETVFVTSNDVVPLKP